MAFWNPWHGCKKISEGCKNCYVYRRDGSFGKDSSIVTKTAAFSLPVQKDRRQEYKLLPENEPVYTCLTSDFFVAEADEWRNEAWRMIKTRSDLHFAIFTKRIGRFLDCLPGDWGDGYDNVSILCTCENQRCADERLPILLSAPIKHRSIACSPMLEEIHIEPYLESGRIEEVSCGGESGENARLCDFAWVVSLMEQCVQSGVAFHFHQTGALFKKGERVYRIPRKEQHRQAALAGINYKHFQL